jgi:hypothetical protein
MTHYRVGLCVILLVYVVQCVVVLLVGFGPGAAIIEFLVGALVLGRFLTAVWRRVESQDGSIAISGYFIGDHGATITAEQLVSIRYRPIQQQAWGRPSFEVAIFEVHGQASPNYYPIARYGWSANERLFRDIVNIVEMSSAQVDPHTHAKLRIAAGIQTKL